MFRPTGWLVGSVLFLVSLAADAQQPGRFLLRVPGQAGWESRADISRTGLLITDAQGRTFSYQRDPEGDSRDGQYQAYYCRAAGRRLRWPAANRGSMYLGEMEGAAIVWRESQMQVTPSAAVVPSMPDLSASVPRRTPVQRPLDFAVLESRDGEIRAAYVDADGRLQFYAGREDRWQPVESTLADSLRPGIPLTLFDDPSSELPEIVFADANGDLMRVVGGRRLAPVSVHEVPRLSPYGHLAADRTSAGRRVYSVDARGRLWRLDLDRGEHQQIERLNGALPPGAPLAVAEQSPSRVALIDNRGRLVRYTENRDGDWSELEPIATGMMPSGHVSRSSLRDATSAARVYFASVDAGGATRLFTNRDGRWMTETAGEIRLPPGAPVGLTMTDAGLGLTAVGMDGRWQYWRRGSGRWTPQVIADGFLASSPVAYLPRAAYGLAVDRGGRLITAHRHGVRWRCHLCLPHHAFAPQLASRSIVPNSLLPPVVIQLANQHHEPLLVKISDRRTTGPPVELKIQPNSSAEFQADRDAGATLEEVYLAPGPLGTLVEQVHRYPLPPQPIYDLVVYADRVTSVYFDRTQNRSEVPDSISRSNVSLGVFPLPPGDLLRPGSRVDVYAEAKHQGNPGAAAWFGPP